MAAPTAAARAALDAYIQDLARVADGLTPEDFRSARIAQARRTAWRVKLYVLVASILFMAMALAMVLVPALDASAGEPRAGVGIAAAENGPPGGAMPVAAAPGRRLTQAEAPAIRQSPRALPMFYSVLWALALGGLGATASIFLHVLKLLPQDTLRASDEFEVVGRLVLGCLFSAILAMTLLSGDLTEFFEKLGSGERQQGNHAVLLVPFLAGYSIPLVLGLLEKSIRAVELTIGLEDRRAGALEPRRAGGGRRGGGGG